MKRPPARSAIWTGGAAAAAVAVLAGAYAIASAGEDARLTLQSEREPYQVVAVAEAGQAWTFSATGLCLSGPGTVTIRDIRLDDPQGLTVQAVGVKSTAGNGSGVTGAPEPLTDRGYRPAIRQLTGQCMAPDDGQWSVAVQVALSGSRGASAGLTIDYTSNDSEDLQTLRVPPQILLCEHGSADEQCQASAGSTSRGVAVVPAPTAG